MPKSLTKTQIAQYDEEGYLAPIPVMAEDKALALRQKLEAIETEMGGPLRGDAEDSNMRPIARRSSAGRTGFSR